MSKIWLKEEDDYLKRKLKEGKTVKEIFAEQHLDRGFYAIQHRQRYHRNIDSEIERIYLENRDKQTQKIYKTIHLKVPKVFTFGYIADNHLNSKFENLHILRKCYNEFEKRGITKVFHAGDIIDGWNVYRGQIYYVDRIGVNNQVNYAIKVYPKKKGITTYFIEGNHDNHVFRSSSMRVGEMIAKERKDMKFMGVYRGDIWLNNTLVRLFHAEGGNSETYSAVRRYLGRLGKKELPDFLFVGHYHCNDCPTVRNVSCIFGKATQNENPFTVHKGYAVSLGAWVLTFFFNKEGKVVRTIKEEI